MNIFSHFYENFKNAAFQIDNKLLITSYVYFKLQDHEF